MKLRFIIADSGGSNTTWAKISDSGNVAYQVTESLHPKYLLNDDNLLSRILEEVGVENVPIFFYGAGCSSVEMQQTIKEKFSKIDMNQVEVYPDTLAACRALLENNKGWVGIFGTGSVLVYFDGNKITEQLGGYGSLIGDEGAGFYFGKLYLKELLATDFWREDQKTFFKDRASVLKHLASPDAQAWISSIASVVSALKVEAIHEANVEAFISSIDKHKNRINQIAALGSYVHAQKEIFTKCFKNHQIELKSVLKGPIENLVSYHLHRL